LLTYHSANRPQEASDEEAARELDNSGGVTFGGASASRMAPLAAVMAEGPPPSGGLALEALLRRVDGAAVKGQWWLSFVLARA
jgi:hypothetical protein